jgi:hypothetical protein
VMKTDGKLFLTTDNANYWGWSVGKTHLGGHSGVVFGSENKHFSLFTSVHLMEHLKAVGFKSIRIKYVMFKAPRKFYFGEGYGMRHLPRLLVKWIFDTTPLWRMSYPILEVQAAK